MTLVVIVLVPLTRQDPRTLMCCGIWIPSCLTYQRINARTWRSFCWILSTCFLLFPQGQIRSITKLMLEMLIQLSSTLTGLIQVSKNTSRKRLSICSKTTSSSQVTVVTVYLFLNQMEVTECVPTIER